MSTILNQSSENTPHSTFLTLPKDTHFSLQNLPFGIFSTANNPAPRVGVAIGEDVLDLAVLSEAGWLDVPPAILRSPSLNAFIALGRPSWRAVRQSLQALLRRDNVQLRDNAAMRARALIPQRNVTMHLPIEVMGYTDFYSSKEHATNVGRLFRDPENALLPNWLHMPIAYNGRASSMVVSGTPIRRPKGQLKLPDSEQPIFAACRKLDFELETAFIVGVPNALGEPVDVNDAEQHIFGMVLLNDWSARDLQQWEYVPLGPFNSKTFATSISPWVVTMDALAPFRVPAPAQTPTPLPYLQQQDPHTYDIHLAVRLIAEQADDTPPVEPICHTNFKNLYWTMAQQLAHHTVSGCNTRIGDVIASGTISGPTPNSLGSLLEMTLGGKNPLLLANGHQRQFIEDGDEIIMTGWAEADDYRVGFGEVSGKVVAVR